MSSLMSSHEHSGVFMSAHQRSLALLSIHEYGAMAQFVLMSANECLWPHGPMLMTALELS